MKPKDYLTNKNFCTVPWQGFMYNFDGEVKHCIRSAGALGNLKDNSITEILHGPIATTNKQNMLANAPANTCHTCYDLEQDTRSFDIISDRVYYLKELRELDLSNYDTVDNFHLSKVDLRWSNLCNFACIYCTPKFSSKWADELNIKITSPEVDRINEMKQYVFDRAHQLKQVYLAGGEPLLMKENLEFLELLKQVNPSVTLRVNTNLSKVDTKIFDLICEFKNVHWTVSVETIEQEFEYIRFGGQWQDFLGNLNRIKQLDHKITFNMLHFVLNFKSIFTTVDYFMNLGFHPNNFVAGPILTPDYLNIRHLPDSMLNLVKQELKTRLSDHPGFLLENSYKNMLSYLDTPCSKDINLCIEKISEMDQRRGLNSKEIFKDFYNLLERQ